MRKILACFILLSVYAAANAQIDNIGTIRLVVVSEKKIPLPFASVSLLKADSTLLQAAITDSAGIALFKLAAPGNYLFRVSRVQYETNYTTVKELNRGNLFTDSIVLIPMSAIMKTISVTARKPFLQYFPDRTVVNVEAGITNEGATVMEVLEKSPGVSIDREGNISLKGKPGVQIMIDGKLTQLSGSDLQNLLTGMNASQAEQIELIDNPSAKYDAAGSAGIINIKTKKNKQKGFNGNINVAYGQGRYYKNNNSIGLNYRSGSLNVFLNYSLITNKAFTSLYALRTYYKENSQDIESLLEQPFYAKGKGYTHSVKAGADYFINEQTTVGVVLNGSVLARNSTGTGTALWMKPSGTTDSSILTDSRNNTNWNYGGVNVNVRHTVSGKRELTADIDYLGYRIRGGQFFKNTLQNTGSNAELFKGNIPSDIHILSAKTDYTQQFTGFQWDGGSKFSHVVTDNRAQYYYLQNNTWLDDPAKSNHFFYTENILALYNSIEKKSGKWDLQGGLRYEYTGYRGVQAGNSTNKDSSFTRSYKSFFPTAFVTYKADSLNSFSIRTGRRIDRPAFQSLNPFVYIINKYTYQQGNPYIRPQYTWNTALTYLYKEIVSAVISYDATTDYFSQLFISDSSAGRIIYTEGNAGKMQNWELSVSAQFNPVSWWSFSSQAVLNHKKIEGFLWNNYKAAITQLYLSINNQFRFKNNWSAELTGYYITKSQNDLQEVLDPTGQLSAGISKQLLKNKVTVKLNYRDIFYSQVMQGLTHFRYANEFFRLKRDTSVCTLSVSYRFGKNTRSATRNTNSADEEINRVGNAN